MIRSDKPYDVLADDDCYLVVRSDCEFYVYEDFRGNMIPIAPSASTSRYCKIRMSRGEVYTVTPVNGVVSIDLEPFQRLETPTGDKLVEIIPEHEMNMYDRLRQDLLSEMSRLADMKEHETFEEANDFDLDDDSDDVPLTPYEFEDMKEEYLIDDEQNNNDDSAMSVDSDSEQQAPVEPVEEREPAEDMPPSA